ncbi:MAG: glycosyltransferase [Lachnospiraceae bacterium]|nr:glycosyltransferase [Lachnospiraceae bacterium]
MKNILIIAEYFAPNNIIAAIRVTKLAKYLKMERNYHVTVLTRKLYPHEVKDPILNKDIKYVDNYIAVGKDKKVQEITKTVQNYSNVTFSQNDANKSQKMRFGISTKNKLRKYLLNLRDWLRTEKFIHEAMKAIKETDKQFDVIISSFGPYSSAELGLNISKKYPKALWIMDMRDPFTKPFSTGRERRYYHRIARKVGEKADYFTAVSGPCASVYKQWGRDADIRIITNGFDRDDRAGLENGKKADLFKILYTGTIKRNRSDLTPLFRAVKELITEGKLKEEKICIEYAGFTYGLMLEAAKENNMQDFCKNYGFISRDESLRLQSEASLLLVASWNSTEETGILTGKVFEYLMQDKPLIALIAGQVGNSIFKEIIINANSGFLYEEVNKEADFINLKKYILKQYTLFENGEPLEYQPRLEYIEQFNWKNLALKFADIIESNKRTITM